MRIGVIQASSQATKNQIIYDTVLKYAPKKSEVINFGCTMEENDKYSYIEISILVGILLASRTVDFVVTGCSSGQGMMLALEKKIEVIFSEPFGQGYPESEAERKIRDAEQLKEIRSIGQVQFKEFVNILDISLLESIKRKQDVIQYVKAYGEKEIADLLK